MNRGLSAGLVLPLILACTLVAPVAAVEEYAIPQFRSLSVGGTHTCGLDTKDRVYCWGDNQVGQLGTRDQGVGALLPRLVSGLKSVRYLSAGAAHTCVINAQQRLLCWGNNVLGQLGVGSQDPLTDKPTLVSSRERFTMVAAGRGHSCAVTDTRVAYCWGLNDSGQLGAVTAGAEADRPMQVQGLDDVVSVAVGSYHSCALTAAQEVWCWGSNSEGQVGLDGYAQVRFPIQVQGLPRTLQVVAGSGHSCALTLQRDVYCWGLGDLGSLGNGAEVSSSSPVKVASLQRATQISAGRKSTCALTGGRVSCWGGGESGEIGNGERRAAATPQQVSRLEDVRSLASASPYSSSMCALLGDGRALCWGLGDYGNLGTGKVQDLSTPEFVGAGMRLVPLSAERQSEQTSGRKRIQISCQKGAVMRLVAGVAPKCPEGFSEVTQKRPQSSFYLDLKPGCYAANFPVTNTFVLKSERYKSLYSMSCDDRYHFQVVYAGPVSASTDKALPTSDQVVAKCGQEYERAMGYRVPTMKKAGSVGLRWFTPNPGVEALRYPKRVICMLMRTDVSGVFALAQTQPLSKKVIAGG